MIYRMTHEQLIKHIRYLADAENVLFAAAENDIDALLHASRSTLLTTLAQQAEAKRIKTPQIV